MIYKNGKKVMPIIGAIVIVLLLLSTVTAVPQQNAQVINEQLDKKQRIETFISTVKTIEDSKNSSFIYMSFLLNIADLLLSEIQSNPDSVSITEAMIYEALPQIDKKQSSADISTHALVTLESLKETVSNIRMRDDGNYQSTEIPFLETLISLLISFIQNNLLNGGILPDNGNSGNGWLSILKNILGVFVSILSVIINGILKGIGLLVRGILRIIGALITIVVLILTGLQTILTAGAFFFLFIGFISKIGIKMLSIIAAPVFALLAAQFSMSMGTLLSGISMAINSILAIALFFAIPLLLVAGVLLLTGEESDDDDDGSGFSFDFSKLTGDGPLYMLLSIFLNNLKQ